MSGGLQCFAFNASFCFLIGNGVEFQRDKLALKKSFKSVRFIPRCCDWRQVLQPYLAYPWVKIYAVTLVQTLDQETKYMVLNKGTQHYLLLRIVYSCIFSCSVPFVFWGPLGNRSPVRWHRFLGDFDPCTIWRVERRSLQEHLGTCEAGGGWLYLDQLWSDLYEWFVEVILLNGDALFLLFHFFFEGIHLQ